MPLIGWLTAKLGLDDTSLRRGLDGAGKYTTSKFKAIGAAAAGAFAASFAVAKMQEIIAMASELKIFASQAGISADQFQRLNNAIERANGDASDSVSIMLDLKRAMADARTGKKDWIDRFALFGITMDQIKKDDPVALFRSIGIAVARTSELTGEQVDALGKMMGEDTSARAIAAFRNNFEKTLDDVNVMADTTIDKISQINEELKKAKRESDIATAEEIARNKDVIIDATTAFEKIKREALIGGAIAFSSISKNILEPGSDYIAEAIRAYTDKNWTKFDMPLKDASPEFKRREEIMGMFTNAGTPSKTQSQAETLNVLKQIRDKINPGASTDAVVMGGL
jgi:murein DD-endopeptidase MepM/ murein hydrolase activator NlpD